MAQLRIEIFKSSSSLPDIHLVLLVGTLHSHFGNTLSLGGFIVKPQNATRPVQFPES